MDRDRTAAFDPEPTFVSSPADRWVYRGAVIRTTRISGSRQLVEQRLRLLQVGFAQALRERLGILAPNGLQKPDPTEVTIRLLRICILPPSELRDSKRG
jgi:hypothetical protein